MEMEMDQSWIAVLIFEGRSENPFPKRFGKFRM
jgi:hypothetical protein